ncbi:MAG: 4Fe-4S binding protein [Candidatus Omnitrophica bacterium]|nr:4Fe-4S binding protein [Candidatus Omnitrophota bacterium]
MFGPLTIKAGTSKNNKTGSWRVGSKPQFLQKNCIGCRLCVSVCPEACIEASQKDKYSCDYAFCKGCGLCVVACPKQDIQMVEE